MNEILEARKEKLQDIGYVERLLKRMIEKTKEENTLAFIAMACRDVWLSNNPVDNTTSTLKYDETYAAGYEAGKKLAEEKLAVAVEALEALAHEARCRKDWCDQSVQKVLAEINKMRGE